MESSKSLSPLVVSQGVKRSDLQGKEARAGHHQLSKSDPWRNIAKDMTLCQKHDTGYD